MRKKIIQVPMEEKLLYSLDEISKTRRKARAEVIREACVKYVHELEEEELDRIYEEGYRKIPDDTALAEAQLAMLSEILPEEKWDEAW